MKKLGTGEKIGPESYEIIEPKTKSLKQKMK